MNAQPRVVLTLLVRDEQDIIRHNLDFHLSQGVDLVIVTDNRSQDATPDILGEYERAGLLHLIHEPDDDYAQAQWVTRMARLAATKYEADWVINADADEFWWPLEGNLASTLEAVPEGEDVVVTDRHDFPPVRGEAQQFYERMLYRRRHSRNLLGSTLPPKACHRASPDVEVHQGNHRISRAGAEVSSVDGREMIEILHFPLRSYAQFEKKIVNGGRAYRRNTTAPPRAGDVWRTLYERWEAGELPSVFEQELLDPSEIPAELRRGELIWDGRLRSWLRVLRRTGITAVPSPTGSA